MPDEHSRAAERRRASRDRREDAYETHTKPAEPRLEVRFPRGWGAQGVLAVAGLVSLASAVALALLAIPYWLVAAGVTLFLATFVVSGNLEQRVVSVAADPATSTVTLTLRDGAEVSLPRSALTRGHVTTHTSSSGGSGRSSTSYGVALRKADGGMLMLCQLGGSRARAEAYVLELTEMLATVTPIDEPEQALVDAARRRLESSTDVSVHEVAVTAVYRGAGSAALEVSWSLAPTWRSLLALPLALGGMATMITGMLVSRGATPTHAAAVLAALSLLSVGWGVRRRGRRQIARVDDEALTLRRVQGEHTVDERRLPLAAVNAVDVAWTGPLMVRIDQANEDAQRLFETVGGRGRLGLGDLGELMRGALALARQTVNIDTGALALHARLDLEIVLGAEIARRTGRRLGDL